MNATAKQASVRLDADMVLRIRDGRGTRLRAAAGVIWVTLKLFFMFFLFAMAKAIVPRYRYDQLMRLGWKVFLPLSLAMVVIVAAVLQFAGLAPK